MPELPSDRRISGLLLPEKREIWVNAEEARRWPYRRRFTIAHEVGHWVLHRDAGDSLRCRTADVRSRVQVAAEAGPAGGFDPDADSIEWEANMFAGALLLPPSLLRRHWDGDPEGLPALSTLFEVSLSALRHRGSWVHRFASRAGFLYEFE